MVPTQNDVRKIERGGVYMLRSCTSLCRAYCSYDDDAMAISTLTVHKNRKRNNFRLDRI